MRCLIQSSFSPLHPFQKIPFGLSYPMVKCVCGWLPVRQTYTLQLQ
jgi:hypothetical protein